VHETPQKRNGTRQRVERTPSGGRARPIQNPRAKRCIVELLLSDPAGQKHISNGGVRMDLKLKRIGAQRPVPRKMDLAAQVGQHARELAPARIRAGLVLLNVRIGALKWRHAATSASTGSPSLMYSSRFRHTLSTRSAVVAAVATGDNFTIRFDVGYSRTTQVPHFVSVAHKERE